LNAGEIVFWSALSLLLLFVLSELSARVLLRLFGQYFVGAPFARTRMEIDRTALPSLEPVVHFEINDGGERGDMLPKDWRNTYRVLVAGGSAAECYFLDQKTSWPYVIQSVLNRPESLKKLGVERVHVGNISRSLVACQHIHRMLECTLHRYERLDVIVFMIGASDLVHWFEKKTPPVVEDEEFPPSMIFAKHPEGPFGWGPRTLALRRIASYWNKRLRRPIEIRTRAGKGITKARAMRARAKKVLDTVPDPAPMLDHFELYLRKLLELAKSRARRVILVRQPWFDKEYTPDEAKMMWSFGTGRPYVEEVTTYYSHAVAWKLMREIDARASAIARSVGVEQLDLMPLIERSLDMYYDEYHHTPKGCTVVGTKVAEAILKGS
jgi:hypothetical protein